jgi:hypothetical protein
VADLRRRRAWIGFASLILVGIGMTLVTSFGAFAGKKAIDPSYRAPLLSDASVTTHLHEPKLGWALFEGSSAGSSGYLIRADLTLQGLKGTNLVVDWDLQRVGRSGPRGQLIVRGRTRLAAPRSDDESRELQQWIPRPRHTGLYQVRLAVKSMNGEVGDGDRVGPIYVIGEDCCNHYRTPMYTSLLPRGWHLDENFAPNAEERFVTLAIGPAENSVDIDTSTIDPENIGGNPLEKARELEHIVAQNGIGYRRLAWRRYQQQGSLTIEWSYRLEGDAFTDIFFYRGPNGFAVLGRSSPRHFRETRDLTQMVAKSVDTQP